MFDVIRSDIARSPEVVIAVTPELLSQYDAVVSIGRTAQECMSMGIPFYFDTLRLIAKDIGPYSVYF